MALTVKDSNAGDLLVNQLLKLKLTENKEDALELVNRIENSTFTEKDKETVKLIIRLTDEKLEVNKIIERLYDLEHSDNHQEALELVKRLIELDSIVRVFPRLVIKHPEAFNLFLEHAAPHRLTSNWFKPLLDPIPLCIERHYVSQYEAIVKKLGELGWNKLTLCPDMMIRPYLVKSMDHKLYKRACIDLRMVDDELDRVLGGEKIEWYEHGSVNEINNAEGYFGYRRAWHMFYYSPSVNKEEFSKHWEEDHYDCTYTAFVHFILWKQGYPEKEWEDNCEELEKKPLEEQWKLFDSLK